MFAHSLKLRPEERRSSLDAFAFPPKSGFASAVVAAAAVTVDYTNPFTDDESFMAAAEEEVFEKPYNACRDCNGMIRVDPSQAPPKPRRDEDPGKGHKSRYHHDLCYVGFTNTSTFVPPKTFVEWGYGYFLCCNCSLKDGWGVENYEAHCCSHCAQRKSTGKVSSKYAALPAAHSV